ncbi:hypothetical protein CC78DRAFT_618197 [Lojkania enalia]|uniref:BRCT domain-containing protein n=1 Tax=Lojkania enalia TaxID=147567 RepID=A0A9P4N1X9_9PLEO|nr:hypothetical protein CC78DRAFT_618197 [Didymosphaeria enalia]
MPWKLLERPLGRQVVSHQLQANQTYYVARAQLGSAPTTLQVLARVYEPAAAIAFIAVEDNAVKLEALEDGVSIQAPTSTSHGQNGPPNPILKLERRTMYFVQTVLLRPNDKIHLLQGAITLTLVWEQPEVQVNSSATGEGAISESANDSTHDILKLDEYPGQSKETEDGEEDLDQTSRAVNGTQSNRAGSRSTPAPSIPRTEVVQETPTANRDAQLGSYSWNGQNGSHRSPQDSMVTKLDGLGSFSSTRPNAIKNEPMQGVVHSSEERELPQNSPRRDFNMPDASPNGMSPDTRKPQVKENGNNETYHAPSATQKNTRVRGAITQTSKSSPTSSPKPASKFLKSASTSTSKSASKSSKPSLKSTPIPTKSNSKSKLSSKRSSPTDEVSAGDESPRPKKRTKLTEGDIIEVAAPTPTPTPKPTSARRTRTSEIHEPTTRVDTPTQTTSARKKRASEVQESKLSIAPNTNKPTPKRATRPHLPVDDGESRLSAHDIDLYMDSPPPRVAFSNSAIQPNSQFIKFLKDHGGNRVESIQSGGANVLCVREGPIRKSMKLLLCLALGIPIVTDKWLKESVKRNKFLRLEDFVPDIPDQEKEWGFSFSAVWKQAHPGLFKGKSVFFTPALKSVYTTFAEVEAVCKAVGAKKPVAKPGKDTIILALEENDLDAAAYIEKGYTCYNKDLLTLSIMRGGLDLESDEFKISNVSSQPKKTARGRPRNS